MWAFIPIAQETTFLHKPVSQIYSVCFEEKEIIFEFFRLSHESLPKTPTNGRIKKLFYQKNVDEIERSS